jgi:hypothetical protein
VTQITEGTPKVTILVEPKKKEFLDWYIGMYASKNSMEYRQAIAIR